jgi:hypothetical protein
MRDLFPIRLSVGEKVKLAKAAVLRRLSLATYVRVTALETADRDLGIEERGGGCPAVRSRNPSRREVSAPSKIA